MIRNKLFIATAAFAASLGLHAQTGACTFETQDYKSISTYDTWADSPFRDGRLEGHARIVDNPYKDDNNPSDKVLAFQRSRYGGQFYGARIELNEPIELSPTTKYVHVLIYSPKGGEMGLVGLGNRADRPGQKTDVVQVTTLATLKASEGGWCDAVFPVFGNEGARILSIVVAPDASFNPGASPDFMTYIDDIVVDDNASPRIVTGDYPVNFDPDQSMTRTDRHLNNIRFTSGGKSGGSITTSGCTSRVYVDLTETGVLNAKPGDIVEPAYGYTGSSMHSYTYLDFDNDGNFDVDLESNTPAQNSDLVAYSYYEGKNSLGEEVAQGINWTSPAFTLPADLPRGFYRVRSKIDWNNVDPAGCLTSGNSIIDNGGNIVDYLLNVHSDSVKLNLDARMCTVTMDDGSALKDSVAFGRAFRLAITMDGDYRLTGLEVTHGYNHEQPQYVHGNRQWQVDEIDANGRTTITIPASYVDGDLSISVKFENAPVGIDNVDKASPAIDVTVEQGTLVLRSQSEQPYRVISADGRIVAEGRLKGTKKISGLPVGAYTVNEVKCVVR